MTDAPSQGASAAGRRFGLGKTIVFSLVPLLTLGAIIEGAFQVREGFQPPLRVDYGLGFNEDSRVFEAAGGEMVTRDAKLVSFNEQRFAAEKPADECRVFIIGGSNVNYLQNLLSFYAFRLNGQLDGLCQVNIINLGGLAYGSQRLLHIALEILEYDPDLLLIYSGHNEFEELHQLTLMEMDNIPLQRVLYQSAAMRFVRDRSVLRQVDQVAEARNNEILASPRVDYMATAGRVFSAEEIEDRMRRYRDHLDRIIRLYQGEGVPVIIGTVPSNLWEPDLPPNKREIRERIDAKYAEERYEDGLRLARETLRVSSRHQASDAENDIIRALAAEHGVPLADVEAAVIAEEPNGVPGETLFSDRCHLSERGKGILLDTYAPHVVEALKSRRGGAPSG